MPKPQRPIDRENTGPISRVPLHVRQNTIQLASRPTAIQPQDPAQTQQVTPVRPPLCHVQRRTTSSEGIRRGQLRKRFHLGQLLSCQITSTIWHESRQIPLSIRGLPRPERDHHQKLVSITLNPGNTRQNIQATVVHQTRPLLGLSITNRLCS